MLSVDDLAPRIRELREEQKKLAVSIRESKSPIGKADDVPCVDEISHALENLGDVMACRSPCSSQGERKEFIRRLVTQVVKPENQALIRYRLLDGKPARQNEVRGTDLFGGAEGMIGITFLDEIKMDRD